MNHPHIFASTTLFALGTLFFACGSPEADPGPGGSSGTGQGGSGSQTGGSGGVVSSGGSGSPAGGSVGTGGSVGSGGAGGSVSVGGSAGTGPAVTCGASPAAANAIMGFATQGGATTGGGNASPDTVSSAGDLEDAVSGSGAKYVRFTGSLSIGSLSIGSNTTLEGADASATINGGISIDGESNIILRNFHVNGSNTDVGGDAIGIQGSDHIWIDHLEIKDAEDGLLDITNDCDYITVSWTKFNYSGAGDHNFTVLIASDDSDSGNYRITFHHNWWGPFSSERMPRVRFGDVHVFNNYYGTGQDTLLGNDHCIRAAYQSNVLVQGNYFDRSNTPHEAAEDQGTATLTAPKCPTNTSAGGPMGCNIENQSYNQDTNPAERGTAFTPPYEYQSAMEPADCVKPNVLSGAGPH